MAKLDALKREANKYPRPDLAEYGRVSDNDPVYDRNDNENDESSDNRRSAAKVDTAKPVAQNPVGAMGKGLNDVEDAVESTGQNTSRNLQRMEFNDKLQGAQTMRALHSMNSNLVRIEDNLQQIYRLLKDERSKPQLQVYRRDGRKQYGNESKEAEPGNGTAGGESGGLLSGLLGGAAAAWLAAKGKGLIDRLRGKPPNPSTLDPNRTPRPGTTDPTRPRTNTPRPTTVEAPKARGRIGAAVDAVRGRTAAIGTAAGEAFERNKVKGRAGLLVAGGAAAVAGIGALMGSVDEASANAEEQRNITSTERALQDARRSRGLPPLEGEELLNARKNITANDGMIPNPQTGFPLNVVQHEAVRAGLMTAGEAATTDNEKIFEVMKANNVTASPEAMSSVLRNGDNIDDPGLLDSTAGKVAVFGGGALLAHTATSALMKPKATAATPDVPTPRPVSAPVSAPEAVRAPSAPTPTTAAQLARAQSLPDEKDLTKVRAGIESSVASAQADTPSAIKKPGVVSQGLRKGVPILGTAMAAYDVYDVVTDKNASTADKVGGVADIAGGTAGALLGAKAGAAGGAAIGAAIGAFFFGAGAVPGAAIGAAIGGIGGGIAGYMGGESITRNAREWLFSEDGEMTPEAQAQMAAQGTPNVANPNAVTSDGAVVAQTEAAFGKIVDASKPSSNPWVSGMLSGSASPAAGGASKQPWSMVPTSKTTTSSPSAVASTGTSGGITIPNVTNVTQPAVVAAPTQSSFVSATTPATPKIVEARATNEVQPVRNTYTDIIKTTSTDPLPAKERKRTTDVAKQNLSQAGKTGKGITSRPALVEISPFIADGGLNHMNTGMM